MEELSSDEELVARAQSGEREAFNQLVSMHRMKAVSWANRFTKDTYLAEDIVQDAFIRSYLYLETLERTDRFIPWLKSIVMNKAIDHLRKNRSASCGSELTEQLSAGESFNPELRYIDQETLESVRTISSSLSERSQIIFNDHFFRNLSPQEIAERHQLTVPNIYNVLSRAKAKLRDHIYTQETERYALQRRESGCPGSSLLAFPRTSMRYVSLGSVMYEVLQYTPYRSLSLSEVMGISGQAFRIQVTEDVGFSSSMIYNWKAVMERTASLLGCSSLGVGEPDCSLTPELLLRSLHIVHQAVDHGVPAMVWNLVQGEFGLMYGYDDDQRRFYCRDASGHSREIAYESLGRLTNESDLFVACIGLEGTRPIELSGSSHAYALEAIVAHALGEEPAVPGYVQGLKAYDTWIEAVRNGEVVPVSHAYQVAQLAEAREHAVAYLKLLATKEPFRTRSVLGGLLDLAIDRFEQVRKLYVNLYPSFPYGMRGYKLDLGAQTIELLEQVKAAETDGIRLLEKILNNIPSDDDRK
ncbi:RNA polymerase sigma factor [Paenibacillus tarimensis]|uniref:RNA polymerase sigma factor n=1 Tax=Paenibacillus tarimensis TaxID=416012 RepID=UPI001F230088|nr:sigma-70 family RNA polymerase sigma factor [Paenibacillus tarimensis]MCF2945140.1 sigma-70 family RNA polymerase sigma factor [Paenibacillus tarimensis]